MIKVRLHGEPEDIEAFTEIIEHTPGLKILSQSGNYVDRGKSVYVRCYLDVEFSESRGQKNSDGGKDRRGYMKGYIYVTLNEEELVLIPVQNIEYIGYDDMGYHVLICLSVGRRREFSVKESIDEIKERLLEAIKP